MDSIFVLNLSDNFVYGMFHLLWRVADRSPIPHLTSGESYNQIIKRINQPPDGTGRLSVAWLKVHCVQSLRPWYRIAALTAFVGCFIDQ